MVYSLSKDGGAARARPERGGRAVKKLLSEFKAFISKGNVIDLAVGVIIGAAFKSIVDSLVNDMISPLIGLLADTNFSEWSGRWAG